MQHELDVKERILKTADELFQRQGYNETGINQIIKEADIAKASLYYHFKTKEDLCVAYLERRNQIWNRAFYTFLKNKKNKVLSAFDFLLANNITSNFRGCSFLNMLSETSPEKASIFDQLQDHKKGLLLFFENELSDKELGFIIYSLFENAIIESQLFRSQEPVIRLKAIAERLILDYSKLFNQ